jgi:hypothetical protein
MDEIHALYYLVFIFCWLVLIRVLSIFVFALFDFTPRKLNYTTSELLMIALSMSYILTYIKFI